MPSGIDAFRRKAAAKEQQKAAYGNDGGGGPQPDLFRLQANQYAVVRFLEQGDDLTFADTHRIPIQGKKGLWYKDFICLDLNDDGTPCPACQSENADIRKRVTRGFINLIWREGPVYKRDEKGVPEKAPGGGYVVVDRADAVFLWKCSWTVLEALREKDSKYKGLMSRDWEIKRTGTTMQDTQYHIEPADPDAGPQPMMIADLALAENKYDLAALTRPLDFAAFAQILNRGALPNGPQPTMDRSAILPTSETTFQQGQAPAVRASAFTRG